MAQNLSSTPTHAAHSHLTLLARWQTRGGKHWYELLKSSDFPAGKDLQYSTDLGGGSFKTGTTGEEAIRILEEKIEQALTIDGIKYTQTNF